MKREPLQKRCLMRRRNRNDLEIALSRLRQSYFWRSCFFEEIGRGTQEHGKAASYLGNHSEDVNDS